MIQTKNIKAWEIPTSPGVYFFHDADGAILYIGKAKNLRSRVMSYFLDTLPTPKTALLVGKIVSIDWLLVHTEVEALLLENNMIKKHAPRYNINLKDAKTYAYLKITAEKFPRILTTRKVTKDGTYFGPYTDGSLRQELLRLVVRLFKLRTCRVLPKNACLNFHIGLCTAPCIGNVILAQYTQQVEEAKDFLNGNVAPTVKRLEAEMAAASGGLNYERALEKRRQLEAIAHLNERQHVEVVKRYDQHVVALVANGSHALIEILTIAKGVIAGKIEYAFEHDKELFEEFLKRYYATRTIPNEIVVNMKFWHSDADRDVLEAYFSTLKGARVALTFPERGDKVALIQLAEKNAQLPTDNALTDLQEKLNLPDVPVVIECFDISNLGYDYLVGAMTRFVNGRPDTAGYRKFKIKSVEGKNDDFASIAEVVYRRYHRLHAEKIQMPDLIIIDGGKGQLDAALRSLSQLGLQIPIIGLAKEREEIYLPGETLPKQFDKTSRMMLLVRAIRDSVHNFAVGYNRKRRDMRLREEIGNVKSK